MRVLALSVILVSSVAAASDDELVGWSADNSFYAVFGTTCAQNEIQLCPASAARPTWPATYGVPDDGTCLSSDAVEALQSLDEGALGKLAPVKGGAGPAGVKVTVASKGDDATITLTKGRAKQTFTMPGAPGAKLDHVTWRPDAKQIAVTVTTKMHGACREEPDHAVAVFDVALGGPSAKELNVQGMAALKKQDYSAAIAAFRDATKADASYLVAHYNLASAASITGDVISARGELETIRKAGTAEAKKILAVGKTDPDLDFASTDPRVRAVIGVGTYPTDATRRLTERDAVWSSEGPCAGQTDATIQLRFGKAGKLHVTAFCHGTKGASNAEKWTAGKLQLDQAPLLGDGDPSIHWTRCPGSEVDGSCFQVGDRVFHRGVPHGK